MRILLSIVISVIYCFPYLLDLASVSIFGLREQNFAIDLVLDACSSIESTAMGVILYFSLFAIHFTTNNRFISGMWTLLVFLIVVALLNKLFHFAFHRATPLHSR